MRKRNTGFSLPEMDYSAWWSLQILKVFPISIPGIFGIAPAGGLGLRVKLNKYSRTNIAIDYGWGRQGSHGFFVNLGEAF